MTKQLLACFTLLLPYLKLSSQDSVTHPRFRLPSAITYSFNVSTSYTNYKNWKYNGVNNYAFLLRSEIDYDSTSTHWEAHLRCMANLGYIKFTDSIWYKNTDDIYFSCDLIRRRNKRLENVFNLYFSSQLLSNYAKDADGRHWESGFGNPMTIDLGYGTVLHFWQTSRISLSFVTLQTATRPLTDEETENVNSGMIYHKTLITSQYGLGLQTSIRKNIGKRLRWENNSRFFCNAIDRRQLDVDFRNRFVIKLLKYLDLIIDSRIRYMPYPPYKFQFRNELVLSFTYERI